MAGAPKCSTIELTLQMLVIRPEQFAVLRDALFRQFDDRALEHVQKSFPEQCSALDAPSLREIVRGGLDQARRYGFESEYDLLRFLNVMFTLGNDFDTRPEHAWARSWLEDRTYSPGVRMDALMEELTNRLDAPAEAAAAAEEEGCEPDSIAWDDNYDPNYVPVSIVPEIEPYTPAPRPGTVPPEEWVDEDEVLIVAETDGDEVASDPLMRLNDGGQ